MTTAVVAGMTITGHAGIPAGTKVLAGSTATRIDLDFTGTGQTGLTATVPTSTVLTFGPTTALPMTNQAEVGMRVTGPVVTGTVGADVAAASVSLTFSSAMTSTPAVGSQVTGHVGIPAGTTVKTGSTTTQINLDFTGTGHTGLTAVVPEDTVITCHTIPVGTTVKAGTTATVVELAFVAPFTGITTTLPASTPLTFKSPDVRERMLVSGFGIPAGTRVASVSTSDHTMTLDTPITEHLGAFALSTSATATAVGDATLQMAGTSQPAGQHVQVGMTVTGHSGVPAGTTVVHVNGALAVWLSNAVTVAIPASTVLTFTHTFTFSTTTIALAGNVYASTSPAGGARTNDLVFNHAGIPAGTTVVDAGPSVTSLTHYNSGTSQSSLELSNALTADVPGSTSLHLDPLQTTVTLSGTAPSPPIAVGMYVTGDGVPTGTWVVSKPSATQIVLSQKVCASTAAVPGVQTWGCTKVWDSTTPFDLTFESPYDGTVDVKEVVKGVSPLGGTFTVSFGDDYTADLPFDASNYTMKHELEQLPGIDEVNVRREDLGTGHRWEVTFTKVRGSCVLSKGATSDWRWGRLRAAGPQVLSPPACHSPSLCRLAPATGARQPAGHGGAHAPL